MLHMKYRTRIYYSETDKALMWERWRQGESLQAIAELFDRNHSAIGCILARTGGIRPLPRTRAASALKLSEREEISRGVMAGGSMRTVARALGRAPSTVSREIRRNGGWRAYRASEADASAWQRARRPKRCKPAQNRVLARLVAEKLRLTLPKLKRSSTELDKPTARPVRLRNGAARTHHLEKSLAACTKTRVN